MTKTKASSPRYKRRDDVVAAAATVFSERGYHGSSTRLIAEKLQIRQGSLYYYFDSKNAALEEVCRIGISEILKKLEMVCATDMPADEKIKAALCQHLDYLVQRRHIVRTFLFCRHHLPQHQRAEVRQLSQAYEKMIGDLFSTGVNSGLFREDIDVWIATQSYFALINAAATHYKPGRKGSIETLKAGFCAQLLHGVASYPTQVRMQS